MKSLVIKSFHVKKVQIGTKTNLIGDVLTFNPNSIHITPFTDHIDKVEVKVIEPFAHHVEVNTIVDIIPIATKALGTLGTGITHTLTGVYVILTGTDSYGRQMNEFGSSEGVLKERLIFGKAGSPNENDYIIHVDVTLKSEVSFLRQAAFSMFQVCDTLIQDIREMLKMKSGHEATERHEFVEKQPTGKTKVAIVKQVAGQGAMYDNLLFPDEPCGTKGGISIIDMNNMPILLTPNEYRDGALRALT